ncbi:MAG: transcription termination/antitermination factor NusG [Tissierellia bacterium]|nr:transcription termination/antitermination factor NusG [Tissierellia bacterium]
MTDESREEKEALAKWYVVHTYSGYEKKVKANIEQMIQNRGMIDDIFEVFIPTEEYVDKNSKDKKVKERKLFPGYVLVKMINTSDSWYLVRNTRGVTGFVGPGSEPIPLTEEEIMSLGFKGKALPPIDLEPGEVVMITDGPFEDFMGTVESVNNDKRKIKVYVSMFGRETLVEMDSDQLAKI